MFIAANYGHDAVVQKLLVAKADANLETKEKWTPLLAAATHGHEAIVQMLIPVVDKNKALLGAVRKSITEIVPALLQAGASTKRKAPLFEAVRGGNDTIVQMLLRAGADANQKGLLLEAIRRSNDTIVQMLLEAGADASRVPLIYPLRDGLDKITRMLATAGSDVSTCTDDGSTPLLLATQKGQIDVVQRLLAVGADVNKATNKNQLPVFASWNIAWDIERLLTTTSGLTPLISAVAKHDPNLVELLLAAHADVNASTKEGWTPLLIAALTGDALIVNLLIDGGASVNRATNGVTTSHYRDICLSAQKREQLWPAIDETPADVNVTIYCSDCSSLKKTQVKELLFAGAGLTPLIAATFGDYSQIVQRLLQAGAHIDHATDTGLTALYSAAEHGSLRSLKVLLDAGGNPDQFVYNFQGGHITRVHRGTVSPGRTPLNCVTEIIRGLNSSRSMNKYEEIREVLSMSDSLKQTISKGAASSVGTRTIAPASVSRSIDTRTIAPASTSAEESGKAMLKGKRDQDDADLQNPDGQRPKTDE